VDLEGGREGIRGGLVVPLGKGEKKGGAKYRQERDLIFVVVCGRGGGGKEKRDRRAFATGKSMGRRVVDRGTIREKEEKKHLGHSKSCEFRGGGGGKVRRRLCVLESKEEIHI